MAVEQISHYSEGLLKCYFADVCEHLTGRTTRVVWKDVIRKNASIRGTVRKSGDTAIIYLRRGLGWEQSYSTFLHECSHVKQDWNAIWNAGGRRERLPDYINKAVHDKNATPLEDKANKLASIWDDYARRHSYGQVISRLDALLEWNEHVTK
jgi:hypothetical protein